MKKRGATTQDFVFGVLIFVSVLSGLFIMLVSMEEHYTLPIESKFVSDNHNQSVNDTYEIARDIAGTFKQSQTDQNSLDASLTGGLNALKISLDMFNIAKSVVLKIFIIVGVPEWIVTPIITAMLLIASLVVIAAFTGRFVSK